MRGQYFNLFSFVLKCIFFISRGWWICGFNTVQREIWSYRFYGYKIGREWWSLRRCARFWRRWSKGMYSSSPLYAHALLFFLKQLHCCISIFGKISWKMSDLLVYLFSCIHHVLQGVKLRPPGRPRRSNIEPGGANLYGNRPVGGSTLWAICGFLNFQDIFIRSKVDVWKLIKEKN